MCERSHEYSSTSRTQEQWGRGVLGAVPDSVPAAPAAWCPPLLLCTPGPPCRFRWGVLPWSHYRVWVCVPVSTGKTGEFRSSSSFSVDVQPQCCSYNLSMRIGLVIDVFLMWFLRMACKLVNQLTVLSDNAATLPLWRSEYASYLCFASVQCSLLFCLFHFSLSLSAYRRIGRDLSNTFAKLEKLTIRKCFFYINK